MQFLYWLVSYLAGTLLTATLLGKLRGINIQQQGSGNAGARNAGRVLGKGAFIWTVLGDGGKVIVIISLGHLAHFTTTTIAVAATLCVIGHIHPFWLKFKGGMGVATCITAMIFLTPITFLVFLAGLLVYLLFSKSLTLSMVFGFLTYSIGLFFFDSTAWPMLFAIAIVVWRHRDNIRERSN